MDLSFTSRYLLLANSKSGSLYTFHIDAICNCIIADLLILNVISLRDNMYCKIDDLPESHSYLSPALDLFEESENVPYFQFRIYVRNLAPTGILCNIIKNIKNDLIESKFIVNSKGSKFISNNDVKKSIIDDLCIRLTQEELSLKEELELVIFKKYLKFDKQVYAKMFITHKNNFVKHAHLINNQSTTFIIYLPLLIVNFLTIPILFSNALELYIIISIILAIGVSISYALFTMFKFMNIWKTVR